ncbi:MAG: hypothetical protein K2X99_04710 [Gemmatimonadaceae bacterium]|nr:hypothetical protein [Gemmatimonadaceae bacterium]
MELLPLVEHTLVRDFCQFAAALKDTEAYSPTGEYARFRTSAKPGVRRGRVFLEVGLEFLNVPLYKDGTWSRRENLPVALVGSVNAGAWYGEDEMRLRFDGNLALIDAQLDKLRRLVQSAHETSLCVSDANAPRGATMDGGGSTRLTVPSGLRPLQTLRIPRGAPGPAEDVPYRNGEPLRATNARHLSWAKSEALREWAGGEGAAHEWFCRTDGRSRQDLTEFGHFLDKWSVGRTLLGEHKPDVLGLLVNEFRRKWQDSSASRMALFASVEEFAKTIRDNEWTPLRRTPSSFASKAAFMCNPAVFAPYDSFGRKALSARGFTITTGDYTAYMMAFNRVHDGIADQLQPAASAMAVSCPRRVSASLASMRILDKLLMAEGGFPTR